MLNLILIKMKTLSLNEKLKLIKFYDANIIFGYESRTYAKINLNNNDDKHFISEMFKSIENFEDLFEAMNDTSLFREEMKVLEHGYATATGSNWDKMVVEFRSKKYVINDRKNWVAIYDGENGFN